MLWQDRSHKHGAVLSRNYGHETNETIDDITRKNSLLREMITDADANAEDE